MEENKTNTKNRLLEKWDDIRSDSNLTVFFALIIIGYIVGLSVILYLNIQTNLILYVLLPFVGSTIAIFSYVCLLCFSGMFYDDEHDDSYDK